MKTILLLLFTVPFSVLSSRTYTATIAVIDDATSKPVPGATVIFGETEMGETDENGVYKHPNCNMLGYDVRISKEGFYEATGYMYSKNARVNTTLTIRLISTDGPNISMEKLIEMEAFRASFDSIHAAEMKTLKEELAKVDTSVVPPCENVLLQEPSFPGGMSALRRYIVNVIEYPQEAIENNEFGQ